MGTRGISVGVWKSGAPIKAHKAAAFAAQLQAASVTCVNLMLNPGVKPWHLPKWKAADLAAVTLQCQRLGIEVWWVFWAVSEERAISEQLASLEGLLAHTIPDGIEFDAEESWRANGVELADALIGGAHAAIGDTTIDFAITSVPHLSGIQRDEIALFEACKKYGHAVEARPQAYSTYQKPKPGKTTHWSWPSFFRPGPIQRHALDQWRPMRDKLGLVDRIRMGLACWAQGHPKPHPTGAEAVEVALETAIADGDIDAVCYWRWSAAKSSPAIQRIWRRAAGNQVYTFDAEAEVAGPTSAGHVREAQQRLADAGYHPGPIDGKLGPRTRAAGRAYARDMGFAPAEVADRRLLDLLASLEIYEEVA